MNPNNVKPNNFKEIKVIHNSPDGSFSIAKGIWAEDGMERFAMRWNGDINNNDDKGFPTSHNHPMWFQLPYNININGFQDMIKVLTENSTSTL